MIKKLNLFGKLLVWLYVINLILGLIPSLYVINESSLIAVMAIWLSFISTTIPIIAFVIAVWHPDYPWMSKAAHVSILVFMIIMFLPNNHLFRNELEYLPRAFGHNYGWEYSLYRIHMFLSTFIGTLANIVTGILAYYYAFKRK